MADRAALERTVSKISAKGFEAIGRAAVRVIIYLITAYAAWRHWRSGG